jgi:uncharacterized protein YqfA (UPF0365 family)
MTADGNMTINIIRLLAVAAATGCIYGFWAYFSVWLRARLANAPVPFTKLVAMSLRRVPYSLITDLHITSSKVGAPIGVDQLEAHYLSGGRVSDAVRAWIMANCGGPKVSWEQICAWDLAHGSKEISVADWVKAGAPTGPPA